jgi:CubicO group peptidase (beta-lactamase class C family)
MAIGGLPVLAAESAAPDPLAARLREYIDQAAAAGFSGVVLVAAGNAQLLHVARGFADFELSVPFSTDHILRIGSLTKPITASAVLRLVERGEIDLKASVCR